MRRPAPSRRPAGCLGDGTPWRETRAVSSRHCPEERYRRVSYARRSKARRFRHRRRARRKRRNSWLPDCHAASGSIGWSIRTAICALARVPAARLSRVHASPARRTTNLCPRLVRCLRRRFGALRSVFAAGFGASPSRSRKILPSTAEREMPPSALAIVPADWPCAHSRSSVAIRSLVQKSVRIGVDPM